MDTPTPIRPCSHMKTLLSAASDQTLSGLLRRYADWHIARCPRCAAALEALRALRSRLHGLLTQPAPAPDRLADERWARLEASWAEADGRA